jgi:hypothetical protein
MSRIKVFTAVTLSISLLLGPTSPVLSQIYSWTDEQGRRQISDRPPEAAVKDLKVKGGRPAGAAPASVSTSTPVAKGEERKAQTLNDKALDFNKRQIEREESRVKQEKAEAEAKERAQRCEQAQAYVRSLQAGGRATRLDPKTGERVFLDDKEREGELADARRSADSWCKPPAPAGAAGAAPPG